MSHPTVVVPLDGSEHALVAIPVAKRLAELEGAALHILHVTGESPLPGDLLAKLGLSSSELRGSILDTRRGDPPSGIIAVARELGSALVVMCTHTATGVDKTVGGTALAVLAGAPCPVVLVRPDRGVVPWELRRILLPHDGTPTTSAAIRPAVKLARDAAAELLVLHVATPGTRRSLEQGALPPPRYVDQPQHEWPAWVGEFIERLSSVCPLESLKVRMSIAHGVPAEETLRVACEGGSDLVVLAWRGIWEGEHAATLKEIIHRTSCPVMVIRTPEA